METIGRTLKTMNGFAVGDVVEVKTAEDILAGLDDRGERESLPFMPEMLKFCGKRFVVDKISHKTCDTVNVTALHEMENTVHLTGLRCDGEAHGGCQAGCLIFWKTDWLTRVSNTGAADPTGPARTVALDADASVRADGATPPIGCTPQRLVDVALGAYRPHDLKDESGGPVYSCQATELPRAFGAPISRWNVRQYFDDVQYGNAPLGRVLSGIGIGIVNLAQTASSKLLPRRLRFKGGVKFPIIEATAGKKTPTASLGLEPGDWVRVKSAEEIGKTLDENHRNRGLFFDREMLLYCGRTVQVLRRVDHIIDEATGRMITMKTPCLILTNSFCTAAYHRSCPRAIYSYWRENWLEPVPAPTPPREVVQSQGGRR